MRQATLILVCLSIAVNAVADSDDLLGGVLIAHHVPTAVYTTGVDWCEEYDTPGYGIDHCDDQINTMTTGVEQLWYVIGGFPLEEKRWCAWQFGLGDISTTIHWVEWGPCGVDPLEIPTVGWPDQNEGNAVQVAPDNAWTGNYRPMYHFWTISYTDGLVPLDVDPRDGHAWYANCHSPNRTWSTQCFGAMGVNVDGVSCCPDFGACCLELGDCQEMGDWDCIEAGGVFFGGSCDPDRCVVPWAPCCLDEDECFMLTEHSCNLADGDWYPYIPSCYPNPCDNLWVGVGTECDPDPRVPFPTDSETWGTIKSRFR